MLQPASPARLAANPPAALAEKVELRLEVIDVPAGARYITDRLDGTVDAARIVAQNVAVSLCHALPAPLFLPKAS